MSAQQTEYIFSEYNEWNYNYVVHFWNQYIKVKQYQLQTDQKIGTELDKFKDSFVPIFNSVRYPNVKKTFLYIFPQQEIFIFSKDEQGKLSAGKHKIEPFMFKQIERGVMKLSKDQGIPSKDFVNKLLVGFY